MIEFKMQRTYEAAQNYLWETIDEISNVIAIFGDNEDCALAARALNSLTASGDESRREEA